MTVIRTINTTLSLIQPGEVKVDLANFDVKLRTKFLYVGFFKNLPIPTEMSCKSFWTSDMTSQNDVFTSILMFFCQKSGRGDILPTPPLPQFYCVYRPPEGGRSPAGLWSAVRCSASQHLNQFPVAGRVECRGWRVLSRACSLSLSYCIAGSALFWADFQKRSALWHTTQRPGEVSLHLVEARSKLNARTPVLNVLRDPGWFRVKDIHFDLSVSSLARVKIKSDWLIFFLGCHSWFDL